MVFNAKIKKWGNSMGVIIPKEMIEEKNLKVGEEIGLEVFKEILGEKSSRF